ncbi:MAG: sulfatase-like hydrolase/transferase, partial [Planctomycetota bacterium]
MTNPTSRTLAVQMKNPTALDATAPGHVPLRFCIKLLVFFFPVAAAANAVGGGTDKRPNMLFILADDLGYGDVGCYGAPDVRTPHLDALAAQGLQMTQMRSNCTVCSPTRAAILSGRYADRAGVPGVIRTNAESNFGYFAPNLNTVTDRFRQAGYETAAIGKWHLGLRSPNLPNERGFDHFHGFLGDMMDDYYTHLRGGKNFMRLNQETINPQGHASDLFSQWSIDYLRERDQSPNPKPFFLYLAYNAPHFPIQPPDRWLQRVRDREPSIPMARALNVALVEHLDDC